MNLHHMLERRADEGRPVRVGLIGAGKFGSMFLAQTRDARGLHLLGIADLDPQRAVAALDATEWPRSRRDAADFTQALESGRTHVTDDVDALVGAAGVEVIVDATGNPRAGIRHARLCRQHGRHLVMVNVEADALAGPLLAREARAADLVYSLAYGDQPALICEMVDWARACGFAVAAAGKGTKYLDAYRDSTPDTVWEHYGLSQAKAEAGGMNRQMFNSFLDGTKSAIEMAAVANETGLLAAPGGLAFPPIGTADLAEALGPPDDRSAPRGRVEVVSSLHRDGRPVDNDLRWGVFVVFEATSDYTARCFGEYGLPTDATGRFAALYRPHHLIGLELVVSVASAALRGEPTGSATGFRADVVAEAKCDLAPGRTLDGEGGYTVRGRLSPGADSLAAGALPLGLTHGARMKRPVPAGAPLRWSDVEIDENDEAVLARRQMERVDAKPL